MTNRTRELAFNNIKKSQGLYPYYVNIDRLAGPALLCSDCFHDEGLRLDAKQIGISSKDPCPSCGSVTGSKLTRQIVRELCYRFFVRGSIARFSFGGFPLIQMNEEHVGKTDVEISDWLQNDVRLIESAGEIGLFYYGARFWMFGEIEPLKALQDPMAMDEVIDRILQLYPKHILNENHPCYRVRVNPSVPHDPSQYDSPPEGYVGNNRFDSNGSSVLYASPDLELCVHECRANLEDELYVAKLVPTRPLYFLNLAAIIYEENPDYFISLDLAIHFLFLAGKHAYPICAHIARRIRKAGFDGIIYPSYFSNTRTGAIPFETINGQSIRYIQPLEEYAQSKTVPNLILFGRPVEEGKLIVHSINKLVINAIKYDLSFGPANTKMPVSEKDQENFILKRRMELATNCLALWNINETNFNP